MATTYLELTNEILRELNEVPLTAADFGNAIGVQQMVKDKINLAYFDIINDEPRWPFLVAAEAGATDPFIGNAEQNTTAGTRWYTVKTSSSNHTTDYVNVDWDSFYITTIGVAGETAPYVSETLDYMSLRDWREFRRDAENSDDADTQNWGQPYNVIRSPDNRKFGLSPIPDKEYTVKYFAYNQPAALSSDSDLIVFPDMYKTVLLARTRYYVWMFKHNFEATVLADQEYKKALRAMKENLLNTTPEDFTDDRVHWT